MKYLEKSFSVGPAVTHTCCEKCVWDRGEHADWCEAKETDWLEYIKAYKENHTFAQYVRGGPYG